MKLAVLCSAGGSVLEEIVKAFGEVIEFHLITDRDCPAEKIAATYGISNIRIEESSSIILSQRICDYCFAESIYFLISYFSRLLHSPLIYKNGCFNVHPSILPEYPGMYAEEKAYGNKDEFIGATLHEIDSGIDTGAIYFQSSIRMKEDRDLETYKRKAFICKVKVSFCFLESLLSGDLSPMVKPTECQIKTDYVQHKFDLFLRMLT